LLLTLALAGNAAAVTRHVPADYATIQQAIIAATPLDTIAVAPGTYQERLNYLGKALVILGADAATTVLDCLFAGLLVLKRYSSENLPR
jgi:pectin methylesterase-like acyl-CoA thioesterase